MTTPGLQFRHEVIDPDPPGAHHDILLLQDLTGNGLPDVVVGCKQGDVNLFWYENPGWQRHNMAAAPELEAGGVFFDVNGNGRPDLIAGQQLGGKEKSSQSKKVIVLAFEPQTFVRHSANQLRTDAVWSVQSVREQLVQSSARWSSLHFGGRVWTSS